MDATAVLYTSFSTLMHASLAHHSPELRTFDDIRNSRHTFRSPLLSLPNEIFSIIRGYLLVIVTDSLIDRTTLALQRYETTLCNLLCQDCRAYNGFVYGNDIWQWEKFSGACECDQRPFQLKTRTQPTPSSPSSTLNPKRFPSRRDWIVHYLSLKSIRVHRTSNSLTTETTQAIWDIARNVLGEYGCTLLEDGSHSPETSSHVAVLVSPSVEMNSGGKMEMDAFLIDATLNRVERGLGLSMPYQEPCRPHLIHSQLAPAPMTSTHDHPVYPSLLPRIIARVTLPLTIASLFIAFASTYSAYFALHAP